MSDRPNTPPPDELAAVRAELKRLETREAELRALLLAEPDVRTGANWVAEVKVVTSERVDIKELSACYPELVAEQTYPSESKRIVLLAITEDGELVSASKFRKATTESATPSLTLRTK